jgi:hypothetical protein
MRKRSITMNSGRILGLTLSVILLGSVFTLPLYSQAPSATFRDLQANPTLEQHETLEITEASGMRYKAKLTAISDRTITVIGQGTPRTLTETQVLEIRHARRDSLWNGALIGVAAGLGAGVVAVTSTCSNDPECSAIATAVFIPTFAAGGAGIGTLIDSLARKHETIFSRSNSTKMDIAPIVGKKVAGVHVSLRF